MPKKLIEVSLPLEAINKEAAREKSIRHGHPSTLHLWWARRPLAACRAVLFSSLVDDPSEYMPDEESARAERERLFRIIEDLVKWENSNNEEVLDKARLEIARSVARTLNVPAPIGKEAIREFLATKAPPVLDPFAGGGSIPLEAQRLGLRAYASDLNPVAVLINKALIEIPPKFANMPPVHPADSPSPESGRGVRGEGKKGKKRVGQAELWQREWKGAQGLAEDVRYYGKWMRDEAFKRIGHLYPPVTITKEILAERPDLKEQGLKPGDQLTVIAWLWARTVKCPNPACGAQMPLIGSFWLSKRKNSKAWIEPKIDLVNKTVQYEIKVGKKEPPPVPKVGRGAKFRCLVCDNVAMEENVRDQFRLKNHGQQLMAIVAEGASGRVFLPPSKNQSEVALNAIPPWRPEEEMNPDTPDLLSGRGYGFTHWHELFTSRQLTALSTFIDIVPEIRELILQDSQAHMQNPSDETIVTEYADAVLTYIGMSISKATDLASTICHWQPNPEHLKIAPTFSRHAIPMSWDFAEGNPFSESSGNFTRQVELIEKVLVNLPVSEIQGTIKQRDATTEIPYTNPVISTDPPYYNNIGYADISDYFYLWLRRSLMSIYPDVFGTMLVPKQAELVASPHRFGGDKSQAEKFFETGLGKAFARIREAQNLEFPFTVFYAFKQSETSEEFDEMQDDTQITTVSTGWETMLEGLLNAGFSIDGTWPMRTERLVRSISFGNNALASSIVLVCRPRSNSAPSTSRREFLSALKKELAPALRELQQGSIAPVDLAQAAIGPGMAVFSRYSAALEANGKPMSVRTALTLINQSLDEYLTEQEGEYDSDTRWALAWFEQFGHNEAPFGVAETLSKAKNTSVNGLEQAGILEARAGKVRLYKRDEMDVDWDPARDKRLTAWESVQHLIQALETEGEASAAAMLSLLGSVAESARDLAYRLYTVCERKGWAQEALGYNSLVVAWPRLKELASRKPEPGQGQLL